jgi:hypothetical protein
MSDDEIPSTPKSGAVEPSRVSPAKLAEKQRLASALRENLKRRKAQARARTADSGGNSGPADD